MRKYLGKLDDYIAVLTALGGYLLAQWIQKALESPLPPFLSLVIAAVLGTMFSILLKGYIWSPLNVSIDWNDTFGAPAPAVALGADPKGAIYALTIHSGPKSLVSRMALRFYSRGEPLWVRLNFHPGDQLSLKTESFHRGRPAPRIDRDGMSIFVGSLGEGSSPTFNRFHFRTAGRQGAVRCLVKPVMLRESELDSWEAPGVRAKLCNFIVRTSSSLPAIDVKN